MDDLTASKELNTKASSCDVALDLLHSAQQGDVLDIKQSRKLLWKIDLRLIPLLCITYALQSIDKTTLNYAAVFGLRDDLGLSSTQYSWAGAIFYLGYLIWEYPTGLLLQKFPVNHFLSCTVQTPLRQFEPSTLTGSSRSFSGAAFCFVTLLCRTSPVSQQCAHFSASLKHPSNPPPCSFSACITSVRSNLCVWAFGSGPPV